MRPLGRRRRTSYDNPTSSRGTVALFVGAILLLLASGALIVVMVRQSLTQAAGTPTPGGTAIIAAATTAPPAAPPTNTAAPPTATPAATATVRPATPATARPASPAATPRATPPPPTARMGGCGIVLPAGFAEEKPGYYPATDRSGFIALDPFDTNGGQRTTTEIAQAFVEGTLKRVLQDYRQTASIRTDDGSRVEYTAQAGGKAGRGVVVVRRVGEIACGVTLFALNDSPIPFDQTLEALLASLQPARP